MVKRAQSPTNDITENVLHLLGGGKVFPKPPQGALAAHHLIERGIPSSAIVFLIDSMRTVVDPSALEAALGISRRTIQRKSEAKEVLSPVQSGRIWKFAEVLAKAIEVFGSLEEAERWLAPVLGYEP